MIKFFLKFILSFTISFLILCFPIGKTPFFYLLEPKTRPYTQELFQFINEKVSLGVGVLRGSLPKFFSNVLPKEFEKNKQLHQQVVEDLANEQSH